MKEVKVEFTEKNLTGNAGLINFSRFIAKLNLKQILTGHISISRGSDADYQVSDAILMPVMGVSAGVKHMNHMAILRTDRQFVPFLIGRSFPMTARSEDFSDFSDILPAMNFPKQKIGCCGKSGKKAVRPCCP